MQNKILLYRIIFILAIFSLLGCVSNDRGKEAESQNPELSLAESFNKYKYKGIQFARAQNYSESLKYLRKAEAINQNDSEVLHAMGESLGRLFQYEDAKHYLERVVTLDPYNYKAYGRLGTINLIEKNDQQAIFYFEKVLELKTGDKGTLAQLADIYFRLKYYEKALEYILLFETSVDQENIVLMTNMERHAIKQVLEQFKHYRTVIQKELNNMKRQEPNIQQLDLM